MFEHVKKPTKIELKVLDIIKRNNLPFEYTGNKLVFPGLSPDFTSTDKLKVIEVAGCYWRGCPIHHPNRKEEYKEHLEKVERLNKYASCFVIWQHDLVSPEGIRNIEEKLRRWWRESHFSGSKILTQQPPTHMTGPVK
jgi:G:T-mismatch repair DNA endonuclease (very short patch repair protein)